MSQKLARQSHQEPQQQQGEGKLNDDPVEAEGEGFRTLNRQTICNFASNMLFAYFKLLPQVAATYLVIVIIIITTSSSSRTRSSIFAYGLPATGPIITVVGETTIVSNVDPKYEGFSMGRNGTGSGNGSVVIGARSLAAAAASAAAAYAAGVSMARSKDRSDHGKAHNHKLLPLNSNGQMQGSIFHKDFPANSANLLLEDLQHPTGYIVNLTRHHDGDVFRTHGVTTCNSDTCVGLSSGTAGIMRLQNDRSDTLGSASATLAGGSNSHLELLTRRHKKKPTSSLGGETCECRCLSYLSTYREDLGICVDDIHECSLSPFISGSSSEKIPFVFLPLRGQIIYPSREISFPDIHTPVCAVTSAQYLTSNGWSDLRNPIDTDYPFRMFRDEGRSFLQWLGENDLRKKMQGRLIVVHLVCRDMKVAFNASQSKDYLKPPKNVFSPCVAFRVNGSPVKYEHNVSEVLFQAETTSTLASGTDGMSTKEYIVIGVCSLLLGLIYVSSVFLYLHMKKRKNRDQNHHMRNSLDDLATEINYPKNDQVTFGVPFHRSGSLYSATSMGTSNEPRSRASIGSLKEEMGIVKNNPLLQHFPQLNEQNSGFTSDISNSASECEMDGPSNNFHNHDKMKKLQTSVMIHPQMGLSNQSNNPNKQLQQNPDSDEIQEMMEQSQETECLPQENVAIVEDLLTEEKLENLRAMVNGNVRKKLYFNPAYFEPHLLAQPPPAAVEFLQKIREVIAIAKYKMATKRYQPSLTLIPEEGALSSSPPSIYDSQIQQQTIECQACATNRCNGHAKNCGDKRNTIEKWLESVPLTESRNGSGATSEVKGENLKINGNGSGLNNEGSRKSPMKSPINNTKRKSASPDKRPPSRKEISPPKERPPPPPVPSHKTNLSRDSPNSMSNSPSFKKLVKPSAYPSPSVARKGSAVSIPVNKNYESFSALGAAANIYGFAETGGEIYNNPKFVLNDSPAASQRSRNSSSRARSRLDCLDHFASASTPTSLNSIDRQHYDMLRNMKQGSDMAYDSITRDYTATMSSNGSFHLDIPTPDYDSTIEKKIKDIYNSTQGSIPPVPTPDYSTLSRKSLKQFQPDSPIYRRKSPQYLIVDYETDSLERLEATKRKSSHSSSSPSSDISSQMSPSLSTALPLEEELEISHAVYDKINGFRKEGDHKKKLVAKPDERVAKQKEIAARIKYDTPFRGSMTIEVEHEPPSDLERSTDSDQFEPDTLDRKPKKQSFCDVKAWRGSSQSIYSEGEYSQMNSLAEGSRPNSCFRNEPQYSSGASFVLKATNSFRSQGDRSNSYESHVEMRLRANFDNYNDSTEVYPHLRDIYESPLMRQNSQNSCKCGGQYSQVDLEKEKEQNRILALEAKHSRRQRLSEQPSPPPVVEITKVGANKTTIKISTPKAIRPPIPFKKNTEIAAVVEPQVHQSPKISSPIPKNLERNPSTGLSTSHSNSKTCHSPLPNSKPSSCHSTPVSTIKNHSSNKDVPKKRIDRSSLTPPPPPPPPPPTSASTTLNSQKSKASSKSLKKAESPQPFGEINSAFEDEVMSEHSQATEMTRISDNLENSRQNTLTSLSPSSVIDKQLIKNEEAEFAILRAKQLDSPEIDKKLEENSNYSDHFNQKVTALRNDYSLNKYLNRRKSQSPEDEPKNTDLDTETNNNNINSKLLDSTDPNKLDVISISSVSNRSSSRLSDRTKEMYRNAGVPVGIAYPQRSSSSASSSSNQVPQNSVQTTVYRCEIAPVQLTQGMQIAMGLKDRAKKAKDLKNAWKKFVSKAAAKFSPTHSPAPPFDKKQPSFLEILDRDEGISSLIDDNAVPPSSTPKSSYSAPASQNYYEQRFGGGFGRLGEMDSGYMSADSAEVYKRSFYDRYNFRMRSGRDQIIRVDTIEDNSDGGSTLTDRPNGSRRGSILDDNRFADLEHMESPPTPVNNYASSHRANESSDTDSDRTLTRNDVKRASRTSVYSSEDDRAQSTCASSETDGETNAEDMWESGAESIETHSVLYKNVRKP